MGKIFKLKIQTLTDKDGNGKLVKTSVEKFVESSSYTEAETIAGIVINNDGLGKYKDPDIEITKTNILVENILMTPLSYFDIDTSKSFGELVFDTEYDGEMGFFIVDITIFGDKEAKESDIKQTYVIPGVTATWTSNYMDKMMEKYGYAKDQYKIVNVKATKISSILLFNIPK